MPNPTPILHGPSLCQTCRHAQIIKGAAISEDFVICDKLNGANERIRFRVIECSKYDDRSRPSLESMQRIAWELCTDKKANKIGFYSPQDRRDRRNELSDTGGYIDPDDV